MVARSINASGGAAAKRLDGRDARLHTLPMTLPLPDTEEARAVLIGAIAERQDRAAFIALFDFYAPRIKAQAMRYGLGADAAEDVAQDAMLSLWRRAGQFDAGRGSASAWVFTIATNARIDRMRRDSKLKAAVTLDDAPELAADAVEHNGADAARLARLMETLPAEQRQVLAPSFFREVAHSDIARHLGIPLGTVKSRIRLAVSRLRTLMSDDT